MTSTFSRSASAFDTFDAELAQMISGDSHPGTGCANAGAFVANYSRSGAECDEAGFIKDGAKNRLREQDIQKAMDVFHDYQEIPGYSRMVPLAEIDDNDYNLNLPRYIDSSDGEVRQDLFAHLNGGIPDADLQELGDYWHVFPQLRSQLFSPSVHAGYSVLSIPSGKIPG